MPRKLRTKKQRLNAAKQDKLAKILRKPTNPAERDYTKFVLKK